MDDTTIEEWKSKQEEVDFNGLESIKHAYHELHSNSFIFYKAYRNLWKDFKKLSKDHKELEKALDAKADSSLDESTQMCNSYVTLKNKRD